ncbi:MAG: beta strand repeat-containing protein, partial [Limisphaerales bacterium]
MNRSFLLRTTRIVASALLLKCAAVLPVHAAFTTWDPFGLSFSGKTNASGYVNVDYSGSWEGNNWSTSQTGQAAPGAWVENTACVIGVNTGLGTPPFTITMNANHTVAGIFIGQQTPNSCTNTITGTGHVIIPSGAQGFYLIKSSDGAVGFLTISNVIAGTGQMALQGGNSGACQIFLYGNNTFSGGVSVGFSTTSWQGLLNYGHNNAFGTGGFTIVNNSGSALVPVGSSAYTIPNNFTISQNNTSMNFVGNSGGVTFSGTWSLGTNTFGFGVGGGTTFTNTLSGVISGSGGIFRQLSTTHGILALTGANTYTGKTTIDSSVTSVSSINSVANPAQSTTSNLGKPSSAATGTLGFGSTTFTGTLRYTGAGETTDRVIDLQGTTGGGTIDQSGTGLLKFTANPTGTGNGPKTLTLQGSTAGTGEMSGIIPDSVSGSTVTTASTASGGTTLTLASVANIATGAAVSGTGIPASTTVTAVNTSTKVITISAATTATVSSGATITVTGVKNFNTVAKAGTGTWTLSGANTHSGGTTFTAGTLNIANPSALGSGTISFNGGSFDNTTGSDLTLANSVSIPGSSTYVGSANNMTFNGTTTLTASKTLTVTANTVTLGGAVSGAFTLTKAGSGTLNLNHANGHTGTTLSAGNLNLGNVAALGTNTFTVSGGTLDNTSGADMAPTNALVSIGGTLTYAGSANNLTFLVGQLTGNRTISVTQNTLSFGSIIENGAARNLTKSGNGTLLLTGNSTNTGSTTVSAGTLKIGSAGTLGSGSYAAALSVTGTFDYNSTAAQTLSGVVSGAGSIVQDGSGELTFSGTASTFTGTITVNSGAVGVGAANGLPANSTLNLNGGTLDMGGNNATIKAIQIAGVTKGAGTYGALGSGAMHETALITSAGILTVTGGGVSTTTVISDNASVTSGNPVTFTVTVTGSGGDASIPDGSVTLYDGATPIGTVALTPTTGTSAQGTFPPTSSLTVGAHSMTGSWAGNTSYGASTSSVYTQSVVQLPVITAPAAPSIVTADAGTTNTLSITVQDPTAVTYQWKKGGVNVANGTFNNAATVSGSTTASLVLTRVLAADASPGDYTCVAHNAAGDATSFAFTLVVNDPVITVQPATSTFSCGTSNALTVTAYGTTNASGLLTYQWYTPDPAGTAITDATNSYLPFPNVHTGGSYSVVVSNAFGNSITSSVAMVTVVDTNAPMLVGVPASVTISCSDPVPSATVTATDTCDANPIVTLSAVTNAGSCPQNSFIVRTWTAHDAAGNTSTGTQTVTVVDTNAPVIALVGGAVTVECHHAYVEPGYSAVDGCAGTTVVNVTSTPALDTNTLGTYTLTYTSTDSCNNTATTNRVVTVIDATPPAMSLNGTNSLTVECHSAYTELGASATDLCAGTLPVNIIGTVDTNTVADYTLTYTAGDPTHNSNQVMRVVHVVDVTPPTFTVLGNSPTNVECHGVFVDPGATANDACSGPAAVTTNNPVNANTAGTYTITYSATDAHNNTGTATRVVHVVDTTPPTAVVNG